MQRVIFALFIRKRLIKFMGLIVLILGVSSLSYQYLLAPIFSENVLSTPVAVILDAGHGGVDPGANDNELKEKDITLDVVLRMQEYLQQRGLAVELTRDTDVDLGGELKRGRHHKDLEARLQIINKGQVAVSIHCNTTRESDQKGAIVLYRRNSEAGAELAETIIKEIRKVQSLNHNFPIPRSNIFLLRASKIPVAYIELGFLSNPEDRSKLSDPDFRQQIAEAISVGIINYLWKQN